MVDGFGQIQYEHEFIAQRDTANAMAGAFLGYFHRQPRTWIAYAGMYVLGTLLHYLILGGKVATAAVSTVWTAAAVLGFVTTVLGILIIMLIVYTRTLRNARIGLSTGTVVRSYFGDAAFIVDTPDIASRISYEALSSVSIGRRFVFMRIRATPLVSVFPREIVPDAAIARMARGLRTSAALGDRTRTTQGADDLRGDAAE